MRALKIILFVILGLVGVFLILALVAPKEFTTTRSIVIDAPPELVFNTVNDLSSWDSWSPWKEADPTIQSTMGEITVGKGATSSWVSENSGNGKMTITESHPNENLDVVIEFEGMGQADSDWDIKAAEGGAEASWSFHTEFPFPINAMMLFQDFEGNIHKDYDRGLELLKGVVEKKAEAMANQKYNGYEVKRAPLPMQHFVAVRETVQMDNMTDFFTSSLGKAMQAVQKNGVEIAGAPCGLYFTWDEASKTTDMAGAIPVKAKTEINGFSAVEIPASEALVIDYYGDYHNIGDAHTAMEQYITATGVKTTPPAIEEYVTDPETEKDASKWLTKVYYPLENK